MVRISITLCMFAVLAAAPSGATNETVQADLPAGFSFEQDVTYGIQSERQRLDILYPTSPGARLPLIVHIHGGGWNLGDKGGERTFQLMRAFAQAGYAAASIGYRFADESPFPAAVEDCKLAVRWFRAHADAYGIDPEHIAAIGGSAGGHLSAMLAVTTSKDGLDGSGGYVSESSAIQAAVVVCGPTNLTIPLCPKYADREDPLVAKFLGGPLPEKRDAARKASPFFYVNESTPPIFLLHGTEDRRVDPSQSTAMADAMRAAGAPYKLSLVEGGIHGMDIARDDEGRAAAIAFFDEHLRPRAK